MIGFPGAVMVAKGPNNILISPLMGMISADNNGVRDQQVFTTTNSFFNAAIGVYLTQLRFDTFTNRWFALAVTVDDTGTVTLPLSFYLAVSTDETLTNGWATYSFQQDLVSPAGNAGDGIPNTGKNFATFGIDQNALYIGVNLFAPPSTF